MIIRILNCVVFFWFPWKVAKTSRKPKKTKKNKKKKTNPWDGEDLGGWGVSFCFFLVFSGFFKFSIKSRKNLEKTKKNKKKQNDTPQPSRFFPSHGFVFFCFFLIFWFRSGRLWQTLWVTDTDEQMKVCCVTAACCGNNKLTWKKILRECTTICVKMTVFAHCHGRLFWIFFGGDTYGWSKISCHPEGRWWFWVGGLYVPVRVSIIKNMQPSFVRSCQKGMVCNYTPED